MLAPGIAAVGDLTVSPNSVNFGAVPVATSSTQTVTITNNTQGPLALGVATTNADFTASPSSTNGCASNLLEGASCDEDVTYTPSSSAGDGGLLQVSYKLFYCTQNKSCWRTIAVTLRGHGTGS